MFAAIDQKFSRDWTAFLADVGKTIQTTEYVDRLALNVWLVNFQKAPSALGFLISSAETNAIGYRILPFADAPQWIPVADSPDQSP